MKNTLVDKIKKSQDVQEKWALKNIEFEKLSFPIKYSINGLDIEILSARGNSKNILEVQLNVRKKGKIIDVNAPFLFQNPPVIHNEKVDLEASLKQFVLDTIKTQLK